MIRKTVFIVMDSGVPVCACEGASEAKDIAEVISKITSSKSVLVCERILYENTKL